MSPSEEHARPIVRWVLAIAAVVLLNLFVWASRGGTCTDYVDAPGVCESGPTVGWPGVFMISLASVIALAYFVNRLLGGKRG